LGRVGQTPEQFFTEIDADRTGDLDQVEFQAALERVGIKVSVEQAAGAMKALDLDDDGTLEISELISNLKEFSRLRRVKAAKALRETLGYTRRTNTSITQLFSRMDADGSGDLDLLELQEVFRR